MTHCTNRTAPADAFWHRWMGFTFAASLLLSTYKSYMASTINKDGLLYLHAAQVFVEQGLKPAIQLFGWPFFSVLIGILHQLTGLNYETAAFMLDAVLLAALSAGFVAFYQEISDGNGLPWIAALIILVSPQLNDYRSYIVRDIGYWSFALWAVLYFVRFSRRGAWCDALAWQACIVAAIAFRIEGVALAALLPLWRFNKPPYGLAWLRSNSLFLLAIVIGLILLATQVIPWSSNNRLDQLGYFLSPDRLSAGFALKAEAIARHAQAFYAPQDIKALLIGGVLFLFIEKTAICLGWLYAPILVWALWKKPESLIKQRLLCYAIAVTAIPLVVFALNDLFLSGRYMGLLTVLLSLLVASATEAMVLHADTASGQRYRTSRPLALWARESGYLTRVLALAFIVLLADIFIQTGPSKRYIREAGNWVRDHVPSAHRLCSNDTAAYYYAGRGFVSESCNVLEYVYRDDLNGFDAFFIRLDRKDKNTAQALQTLLADSKKLKLAAQFNNKVNDKVLIILRNTQ